MIVPASKSHATSSLCLLIDFGPFRCFASFTSHSNKELACPPARSPSPRLPRTRSQTRRWPLRHARRAGRKDFAPRYSSLADGSTKVLKHYSLQIQFQTNALPSTPVGTALPWALPARSLPLCFLDLVASGDQTRPACRPARRLHSGKSREAARQQALLGRPMGLLVAPRLLYYKIKCGISD